MTNPPAAKPLSISLSAKPLSRAGPPSKKRAVAALGDSDSDDDERHHHGKVQLVSAFDSTRGGAIGNGTGKKKESAPLVIPKLKNKDWRAEAQKKKAIYLPPDARREKVSEEDLRETDTGEGQQWGLVVPESREEAMDVEVEEEEGAEKKVVKKLTEDEIAIAALMGEDKRQDDLVIASAQDKDWRNRPETEDDAYRRDVESRPDVPTLDQYAAVPVEEFGAALLRGMGWKGGDELKSDKKGKPRVVEKRPAFLGIGAKPQTEVPELGSWGKGDKKKGRRPDTAYTPVVKVNKKTGEIVEEKPEEKNGKRDPEPAKRKEDDKPRSVRDESWRRDDRDAGKRRERSRCYDDGRRRGDRSSDRSGGDRDHHHRDRNGDGRERNGDYRNRKARDGGDRDRDRDRNRDRDRDHRRKRSRSRDRDYNRRDRRY